WLHPQPHLAKTIAIRAESSVNTTIDVSTMRVSTKISALVLVTVATLLYSGITEYRRSAKTAAELEQVDSLVQLSARVSALVHETQKERGMTAGYLGSQGKSFVSEIRSQHQTTDGRRQELEQFAKTCDFTQAPEIQRKLQNAFDLHKAATKNRSAVLELNIPAGRAITAYTKHNKAMLDVIGSVADTTTDSDIARQLSAYSMFLRGKERAGIERAVLSSTFSQDKFGPGAFTKFISLIADQDTYFREFKALASQELLSFYETQRALPCVSQVAEYRKIAIEKGNVGGFGQDATQWFASKTAEINGLKAVDDFTAKSLLEQSSEKQIAAERHAVFAAVFSISLLVAATALGLFTLTSILRSIRVLVDALADISQGDGDLTKRLGVTKDEFGAASENFNRFADRIRDSISEVKSNASSLKSSATELSSTADQLNANAEQTNARTGTIAAAAEEMSMSVNGLTSLGESASNGATSVSQRLEEIMSTLQEVNESTEQSAATASQVAKLVDTSTSKTETLSSVANDIGKIVDVIQDIAEQTNLLALNATIEAARAGESGKGFAVVATEVKALAAETSRATDQIREQVVAIQKSSEESLDSVREISTAIESVNDSSSAISAAVAGQLEVTEEMSASAKTTAESVESLMRAISESAEATREIADNIQQVESVANATAKAATHTGRSSGDLESLANSLDGVVSGFVV
ncbi:MAG: methyl-accepting chemotaxis protein, partial [Planctomycetota bacterium]